MLREPGVSKASICGTNFVRLVLIELAVVALLANAPVAAQEISGQIRGVVVDAQGAVVPRATVTATHVATNTAYRTTTSNEGAFVLPNVRLGQYAVAVEGQGFRRTLVQNVNVEVGGIADLNVALQAGAVDEQVEVSASAAQEAINTTNAELGTVVDDRRVQDLPLDGRNASHLALLQAGVFFDRSPDGQGDKLIVNGQRHRSLGVTLDGVDTQDNLNRASSVMLDQPLLALAAENVQEFRVVTGIASAEFSRGGAQITAITRAGTNRFHGSIFEFHRNTALNANEFFNNAATPSVERPPLLRHQFGGRIGGPIFRDRTFFFFGYEQTRESKGVPVNRTVYTAEARQGIFRYLTGLRTTPENVVANPGLIRSVNLLECSAAVQSALSRFCVDSRFTAANPASLDPFIRDQALALVPLPNNFNIGDGLNTGGFRFNAPVKTVVHLPSFRLDHRFNDKHSFFGTVNYNDRDIRGDFINDREPVYPGQRPLGSRLTHSRSFSGTLNSSLAPAFVNELRFGLVGAENAFLVTQPFDTPFALDFNTISDPYDFENGDEVRDNRTINLRNTSTWVRGSHQTKFGVEWRDRWMNTYDFDFFFPAGSIDFNTTNAAVGFTAANLQRLSRANANEAPVIDANDQTTARGLFNNLVGAIGAVDLRFNVSSLDSGFLPGAPTRRTYRNREFDAFFQDTWAFRKNLTLNLGLRWEYSSVPYETNGLLLVPEGGFDAVYGVSGEAGFFKPGTLSGKACSALQGLPRERTTANAVSLITTCATRYVPGSSSNGLPLWKDDLNNFGPVLSFAYDPFKDGKTSIRAGFRISYFQDVFSIIEGNVDDNEGLQVTQNCIPTDGGCANNPTFLRNVTATNAPIPRAPAFQLPAYRSILDTAAQDFRTYDQNLGTSYYKEWTVGVQRQFFRNVTVEARYVGNRGSRLRRVADFNEINIFARDSVTGQTFLESFRLAQQNLACNNASTVAANQGRFDALNLACSVANPLMDALIAGEPARLRNRTSLLEALLFNAPGEFAYRLMHSETSVPGAGQTERIRGGSFWGAALAGRLPVNFFQVNPFIASSRALIGDGTSSYDALQVELQQRFASGLTFQVNYTFGKALADFDGDANEYLNDTRPSSVRDPNYTRQQIMPRHQINANWVAELPFGRNKRFLRDARGLTRGLVGGWQVGGIISFRSGRPLTITSGVGTFHRSAISGDNTVNLSQQLTGEELRALTGRRDIAGGIFWFDPCMSSFTGAACQSQNAIRGLFQLPSAGQLGQLPQTVIYGPRRFNLDFNLAKRTRLGEGKNLEFRWEVFNVLNNVNFSLPVTDIFSPSFGQITRTTGNPRLMQFALKVNF